MLLTKRVQKQRRGYGLMFCYTERWNWFITYLRLVISVTLTVKDIEWDRCNVLN